MRETARFPSCACCRGNLFLGERQIDPDRRTVDIYSVDSVHCVHHVHSVHFPCATPFVPIAALTLRFARR